MKKLIKEFELIYGVRIDNPTEFKEYYNRIIGGNPEHLEPERKRRVFERIWELYGNRLHQEMKFLFS